MIETFKRAKDFSKKYFDPNFSGIEYATTAGLFAAGNDNENVEVNPQGPCQADQVGTGTYTANNVIDYLFMGEGGALRWTFEEEITEPGHYLTIGFRRGIGTLVLADALPPPPDRQTGELTQGGMAADLQPVEDGHRDVEQHEIDLATVPTFHAALHRLVDDHPPATAAVPHPGLRGANASGGAAAPAQALAPWHVLNLPGSVPGPPKLRTYLRSLSNWWIQFWPYPSAR